jgi:hypothetical protein
MDFAALATGDVLIGLALYAGVCALCWWLLVRRRYVILLLWPVLIYFPGPTLTDFFAGVPGLGQYIFAEHTLAETLAMLAYVLGLALADELVDLSAVIEGCLFNATVRPLAASPLFLPVFLATALLAIVLQVNILRTYGTVLTGNYAYWESLGEQESGWGFLAGLYEIIFLCFVVALLSAGLSRRTHRLITALYALTAVLRLAGGTRLVLVKELALLFILLFLERRIHRRQLIIVSVVTLLGGGAIGLLRSSGGGAEGAMLGPLYGVVIESAFNALSFNIAYQAQLLGGIDPVGRLGDTLCYLVLSVVPSFLRGGIGEAELLALGPYSQGLGGFSTVSPVGGMSGFATLTYVTGNVMLGVWLLVLMLAVALRFTPASRWKRLAVLVFALNAIHFWRDPMEISFKLVVQDMLIVLLFHYVPCLDAWRAPRSAGAERGPAGEVEGMHPAEPVHPATG